MHLGELFELEPHGSDAFVGSGPRYPWGGLYGGQIVAQALRAASATVDADLAAHSLRAYFIRRGDNSEPVRYEVDRIRNGTSFCTRRVVARQGIGAILNLEASFHRPELGPSGVAGDSLQTVTMPAGLPAAESLESSSWTSSFDRRWVPAHLVPAPTVGAGRVAAWMRVTDPVVTDELVHRCWLAYLSDDLPTDSVRHALGLNDPDEDEDEGDGTFTASLDHTVWFHRPMRIDEWHLHDMTCHGYVGARGLAMGHVFALDGTHVATVSQEVLLRSQRRRT